MKNLINNELELQEYLMPTLKQALDNTIDYCLNKLGDYIEKDVYSYDYLADDNGGYGYYWQQAGARTGQFKNSWQTAKHGIMKNIVEAEIYQDESIMMYFGGGFQHGNSYEPVSNWGENALAAIINYGASGTGFNFPHLEKRPFWDDFVKWMNNNFYKRFRIEASKLGLRGEMI